jgi:pterin-4a-carbinolamine dehydratase
MSPSPVKSVFISYRRRDSSQTARWLSDTIAQNFGQASVFIDTRAIQTGEVWRRRIEQALKKTSVLIAVIGPDWIKAHDTDYKRRIDDPKDWVHREIYYAIQHKLTVIPLRILGTERPRREALPENLRPLLDRNDFELRDEQRETDVEPLLNRLEELGFERTTSRIKYPPLGPKAPALTEQELKKVLKSLPGWEVDETRFDQHRRKKRELKRIYEFASFEDAIHFMSTASRYISDLDHHPDWENIWKTIQVWLTTWDIGHKPSSYDVDLAEYLDWLFKGYESTGEGKPTKSPKRKRLRSRPSPKRSPAKPRR